MPGGGTGSATVLVSSLGSGRGTVTASGSSFTCASGATCPLLVGGSMTLIATPDASSTFIGWEGGCNGSNCMVSPASNGATVAARFALNGYLSKVVSGSAADLTLYGVTPVAYAGTAVLAGSWAAGTDYGDGKLLTGLVLARYDANGALLQTVPFQGATSGAGLVIDSRGWFVVAGTFTGTLTVAGHSVVSNGSSDVFYAVLSSIGAYVSVAGYGGSGADSAAAIAIDGFNNVALLGHYGSTITFANYTLSGGPATFVAKFNVSGPVTWAATVVPPSSAASFSYSAVGCDQSGNSYIAGNATAGGSANALNLQSFGPGAPPTVTGQLTLPGPSTTHLRLGSLSIGPTGLVTFAGDFAGSMDFGAGTVTTPTSSASAIYLARYSAALTTHVWSKELMSGGNDDAANAVFVDGNGAANGNVYLAGKLGAGSRVDFGGGPITAASQSGFLAEWTSAGAPVWSRIFAASSTTAGNASDVVAASGDSLNDVAVGGLMQGTVDLGDAIRSSPGTSNTLFWVRVPAAH